MFILEICTLFMKINPEPQPAARSRRSGFPRIQGILAFFEIPVIPRDILILYTYKASKPIWGSGFVL
jgi:hypothetical protein